MYFTWSNFALGLIGIAFGVWVTINAYHINHEIWYFSWAEKKLGSGMGTIAYRWVGVAFSIFSLLVMFGQINLTGSTTTPTSRGTNSTGVIPTVNNVQIAP